jgi:hypothetical protein
MADSKIEMKVGAVSFAGEGTGDWLGKQLDKVLAKLPELIGLTISDSNDDKTETDKSVAATKSTTHTNSAIPLAAFIKDKKATTNQVRKFLATAAWLHDTTDQKRLSTGEITKALSDHNQGKLTNASQSLNNNAKTGAIVKEGKKFYVSEQGRTELDK